MSSDALKLTGIVKQYGKNLALNNISLTIKQGDFFGLLGPNGAGKSTTIGIISSLVNKTEGQVQVFGYDLDQNRLKAKACMGLVPQEINFNVFETPFDIVVNQAGYYGMPHLLAKEKAEFYLKKLSLWDKAFSPSRMLSGGMKRRLMIARAMVHEPRLLILDEPTAGVDIEIRHQMWIFLEALNKAGCTIVLTTHNLEEAELLCKNIAIIDKGNIIEEASVKELIIRLHKEILILDLIENLNEQQIKILKDLKDDFEIIILDPSTIEVRFRVHHALNSVFNALSQIGCLVRSLRNKTNRLEGLFLDLIAERDTA